MVAEIAGLVSSVLVSSVLLISEEDIGESVGLLYTDGEWCWNMPEMMKDVITYPRISSRSR